MSTTCFRRSFCQRWRHRGREGGYPEIVTTGAVEHEGQTNRRQCRSGESGGRYTLLPGCARSGALDGPWLDRNLRLRGKDERPNLFPFRGGSDTPVPGLSIEGDDLNAALERMRAAGFPIEYGSAERCMLSRFYEV